MAVLTVCPACGLESSDFRCPRCFALKVVACGGSCSACGPSKKSCCGTPAQAPSERAREDAEHPGTPLER